jgi:hypothetical protein
MWSLELHMLGLVPPRREQKLLTHSVPDAEDQQQGWSRKVAGSHGVSTIVACRDVCSVSGESARILRHRVRARGTMRGGRGDLSRSARFVHQLHGSASRGHRRRTRWRRYGEAGLTREAAFSSSTGHVRRPLKNGYRPAIASVRRSLPLGRHSIRDASGPSSCTGLITHLLARKGSCREWAIRHSHVAV